jgi:hypothetical protein
VRLSRTLGISLAAALAAAAVACDPGIPPGPTAPAGPTSSPSNPATTATPTTSPTDPAATPTATTAEPTPTASSSPELRWAGTWSSPSCADRTYERRITLKEDKTFRAEDRVSPCPPGVQCIWSGIVGWQGTYTLDEKGAVLTKTAGGQGGPGGAVKIVSPLRLELDKATSSPAEVHAAGRCVYVRATEATTKSAPPSKQPAPSSPPAPVSQ